MTVITTARGAAIAYDTFGDAGARPLVLIQGLSAHRFGWRPGFCEALADRGFHVTRFDNRDIGQSQRYPEGGYDLADMADDVVALLDQLQIDSAHIVGQSMGGIIAQFLATGHPERVRSLGLVYTSASLRHFIGADDVVSRTADALPATREDFIARYLVGERICSSLAYPQDTEWLAELGGQMWDNGVDDVGVDRQLQAILALTDRVDEARTITVPTVVLAGDGDRLIDYAASLELHGAIAGSTLRILPGMGHELPQPLWSEVVRLLAENGSRAEAAQKERNA